MLSALKNLFNKREKIPEHITQELTLTSLTGIKVYIFSPNVKFFESSEMKKVSDEVHATFFSSLNDLIIASQIDSPNFIITVTHKLAGIGGEDETTTKKIVEKMKEINPKTTIIGVDDINAPMNYLSAGFDYFLSMYYIHHKLTNIMHKIFKKTKFDELEKSLVYEKEDFYDYVAKNKFFDKRSKTTANTRKELVFLSARIMSSETFVSCNPILDAGCGNGRLTIPLAAQGYEITGIDISQELINQAEKNNIKNKTNAKFVKGNLLHTPFESDKFGTILLMWHVICEFREYLPELIQEIRRILKPGGKIIFDVPILSKHITVSEAGVYENQITPLKKYVGLVPDLNFLLSFLQASGFAHIIYEPVNWGINKVVFTATKYTEYESVFGYHQNMQALDPFNILKNK